MAAHSLLPTPAPMQEGLRPYIIYPRLPDGCIPFELTDDSCEPLMHRGECLVIDVRDREPAEGELFLIQWFGGRQEVIEPVLRENRGRSNWYVWSHNRPRSADETCAWLEQGRAGALPDGPYAADAPPETHLRQKIIGKIVGILEMDFRPMLRIGQPESGKGIA